MKRFLRVLVGIWVLNPFLFLLYLQNRPLWEEFMESGAEMYSCIDWDANGHSMPGVCADPMPTFPWQ